jgi:hypothetical protein
MNVVRAALAMLLLSTPAAVGAPPASPAPHAAKAALTFNGTLRTWDGPRFKVRDARGQIRTFSKGPGIHVDKGVKPGSDVVVTYTDQGQGGLVASRVSAAKP